ncbi:MAG: hypothetical protein JOZ73_03785 [Solirubrobacterales bacterium]|nr:hypothetical protein [Solirubrobacterales bacterium]
MRKHRLPALTIVASLALGLAAVPAAQAKVVTGKYNCYVYSVGVSTTYLGAFKLKSHGKYNAISPKKGKGKYTVRGKKIKFTSGPYKKFSGKVTKSTTGQPELMLHVTESGQKVQVNCFHS